MADNRELIPGQLVTVDVPNSVRHLLPVGGFRVTAVDEKGVQLRADSPFADGIVAGTPVTVATSRGHRPMEGLIVANMAPTKLVVMLEALPERREHERAQLAVDGELQVIGEPGAFPMRFTTTDVSEGGLGVRVMSAVRRGDRAFVTLDLPGNPILAIGQVLECAATPTWYDVRLRFTSLADSHRLRLARLLLQVSESALNAAG